MEKNKIIKKQLLFLLRGGNAHIPINRALHNFPMAQINEKIKGFDYSPWQLLEHIRIAQDDILEFVKDQNYKSPNWPEGYWPDINEDVNQERWHDTVQRIYKGLEEMEQYVKDESCDLFAPLPDNDKYTIYREILVLAGHNSYHLGQLMMMQKVLSNQ